ncbi:MAG: hypothetical protein EBU53_02195 [Proteobacteria bacterium]|nr:hypothetical protein [Pseudomonadota bacterium]
MANRIGDYYDKVGRLIPTRKERATFTDQDWKKLFSFIPPLTDKRSTAREVLDKRMGEYVQQLVEPYSAVTKCSVEEAQTALYSMHYGQLRITEPVTVVVSEEEDDSGKGKDHHWEFREYDVMKVQWEKAQMILDSTTASVRNGTADVLDRKIALVLGELKKTRSTGVVLWRIYTDPIVQSDGCTFALCRFEKGSRIVSAHAGLATCMDAFSMLTMVGAFRKVGHM